ncbi:MAG: NAD(P)H-hydrate epimerase, partial [Eggerthellaceae bacterium]|nr:NAD(P)H-hydrate epimerase [Eggerthellaceae bacterium]
VMARLVDEPVPAANDRKRDFCLRHHIALWDVLASCEIEGASDASIRNARPNDLASIVNAAPIEAVFCTGAKAFELYRKLGCEESCGLPAIKLPSTSPANAAFSLEKLIGAYAQIFEHTHEYIPPVLDVSRVVELEHTVEKSGTPLAELMDRAGAAIAYRVQQVLANIAEGTYGDRIVPFSPVWHETHLEPSNQPPITVGAHEPLVAIFCGTGNNGGDGWVAAELLNKAGVCTCLLSTRAPEDISAQPAHDAAIRAFPQINAMTDPASDDINQILNRATIVVDALFGCGLRGGITREPYASWVYMINHTCGRHITIAVDVPSGVSAQDGYATTQTTPRIIADETITMMVKKPGLSALECGQVRVAPLAYIEPLLV